MKTLILLSLLMVGCILESRPEYQTETVEQKIYLEGVWQGITDSASVVMDVELKGVGDTITATLTSKNKGGSYKAIYYRDTLEILMYDTLLIKFVKKEELEQK